MNLKEAALLGAALFIAAAACLDWMPHLGMEYDEAHYLPPAVAIAHSSPERIKPPDGLYLFHRPIPFMTMPYLGALDSYLYAIPIAIFGAHPMVTRGTNLAWGLTVIVLAWFLARRFGGLRAAVLCVLLLLLDLEFLLHLPTNFGPFLLQMILGVSGTILVFRWIEGASAWQFIGGCFLFGLAFTEKLTFLWILGGLGLAFLLFYTRPLLARVRLPALLGGLIAGAVACIPVIVYTLGRPEIVLGFGRASTKAPLDFPKMFADRMEQFRLLMDGQITPTYHLGDVPPERLSALFALFWIGLLLVLFAAFKRHALWRPAAFCYTVTLAIVGVNMLFPEGGRIHHLLLAYPYTQVGMALAFVAAYESFGSWRKWTIAALAIPLLATAFGTLEAHIYYTDEVKRTGGRGHWSVRIFDLAEWISQHRDQHYVFCAWGMMRQTYSFSKGEPSLTERYFELLPEKWNPDMEADLKSRLARRDTLFVFSTVMPQYESIFRRVTEFAARQGQQPREVKVFYDLDRPLFQVISFHSEEPTPVWKPLDLKQVRWNGDTEAVVDLAEPAARVRVRLSSTDWDRLTELRAQFLDDAGRPLASWWRPFEWYPMTHREETYVFGRDRYPNYFWQGALSSGEARRFVLRLPPAAVNRTARITLLALDYSPVP